jgi:putative transposase
MRKTEFACEEYYHIYNRGVDKREIFLDEGDYERFLKSMREFNRTDPIKSLFHQEVKLKALRASGLRLLEPSGLVEIICYCLNPNHYHFILKQIVERGIERFMHKVGMGYTNFFNKKYDRSGSLFQGPFKAIHIDSNEYLLYLSAYINANHFIHGYEERELSSRGSLAPTDWEYSSLQDYLGKRKGALCDTEPVLGQFDNNISQYEKYLNDNAAHFREKKEMEKYYLE